MNYVKTLRLTTEEEIGLIKLAKNGDAKAIDTLLRANYMYIYKLANKYSLYNSRRIDMQDLLQEGCIGFLKGITKFDPDKIGTVKFISYIQFWIKEYMRAEVRSTLNKDQYFQYKMKMINESEFINRHESPKLLNTIIDRRNLDLNDPEKILIDNERNDALNNIMRQLRSESGSPERDIIDALQDIESLSVPVPVSEIGRKHGVSRQRIDQRKKAVCHKIREAAIYHSIA